MGTINVRMECSITVLSLCSSPVINWALVYIIQSSHMCEHLKLPDVSLSFL